MVTFEDAVMYQTYLSSFTDSNGIGISDLPGSLYRLDYLVDLGVDVLWLNPILPRPTLIMGMTFRTIKLSCRSLELWPILTQC